MAQRLAGEDLARLAREARAYLKAIRHLARPLALRTQPPSRPPGLSDEWLREYGDAAKIALGKVTDAEALTMVAGNRHLLPFLRPRMEARFSEASRAVEPVELQALRDFFVRLGSVIYPSGRGQPSDFDVHVLQDLKRERIDFNRRVQAEYRRSGTLPDSSALPVVEPSVGHFVTIDDRSWPTEAAWVFLEKALGAKRAALQDRMKPSRGRQRRRRKPRRKSGV